MAGLIAQLFQRLQPAFDLIEAGADPVLRPSTRPGVDLQANGAMPLGKRLGRPPAEVAAEVVAAADLGDMCDSVEVTPQGFVNLTFSPNFLAESLAANMADPHLGVEITTAPRTVVVDYSHPNVAKEMAAHHVRTTVIGDALCRLLTFAGDHVIRENHIGDWGTPFGMLIEHLIDAGPEAAVHQLSVGDLDGFYRQARADFDASEEFRDRSRHRVVLLQSGDPDTLARWRVLVDQSIAYFSEVYAHLGVLLTPGDVVGESFYNELLAGVVADLDGAGLLVTSDGARCVFPTGYANREGQPLPLIVQKSDGGYTYATTDLAAIRDRFGRLGADLLLYVVGAPQAQHLQMCFDVASAAGWVPAGGSAVHVSFGNMLGADRKMFKTRAGDVVKLRDLVDQAISRAAAAVADKSPGLEPDVAAGVARAIGIGALKYADLSTERTRDYVFDWDRMLAFEGNTAPYLQYAHARIHSIFRRGEIDPTPYRAGSVPVVLTEPAERALAVALLGFDAAVEATLESWSPHKLCTYLFDLAGAFTTFYENCSVLRASDAALRHSRLSLSAATAAVLASGLGLLGIEAPDSM